MGKQGKGSESRIRGRSSWLGMVMGIWLFGAVGLFALRFATSWIHQLP